MHRRAARPALRLRLISIGAMAIIAALLSAPSLESSTTAATAATTSASTTTTTPSVKIGPNGGQSSAIIAQNKLPGTTSWRLRPGNSQIAVRGFANLTYAAIGQSINLYVTTSSPRFRAVAYRMGWYQGRGGRQIWSSPLERGVDQPACTVAATTNMVSCANWTVSLKMFLTKAFVPGDYLIKLVVGPEAASYVLLTVWDPHSTAAYVIMNRSLVEQGWNTYGGYSFYSGIGPCILDTASYPACNRARVVSFDRPYDAGSGASDFLTNEYPLVQMSEREGLDVTYISDVTLDEHPNLLLQHGALLSLDHDESWTYAERLAVQNAVSHGVNIVYFGAAAMVRHVRLQPSPIGADREEVDYRNAYEDPLNGVASPMQVTSNTWDDPPASWPPTAQIGEQYSGYLAPGVSVPMVVLDASSWVFRGTGLRDGSSLPGVIGSDFDHVTTSSLTPSDVVVLAHSPIPVSQATTSDGEWGGVSYSDMVYFTSAKSRAGVIDTGNNMWIADLRPCVPRVAGCPTGALTRITNNVLELFGRGPAGDFAPAVSNVSAVSPYGS